jgi:hypothetical protein
MIECEICNRKFMDVSHLSNHIKVHNIKVKDYYDKYLKKSDFEGKCIICNKNTRFNGLGRGYSTYCSKKCISSSSIVKNKKIHNSLKKYSVKHPIQLDSVKKKRKENIIKKYGYGSFFQTDEFKKICKNKYGVENPSQCNKIKDKNKKYFLESYGVENPSQCDMIKEKRIQTCLKKFGVEYPLTLDYIKDKLKNTCLKNYGVENPSQSKEIQKKIRKTRVELGYWIALKDLSLYEKYRRLVLKITEKSARQKFSIEELNKRTLCGVKDGCQIDHRFSVTEGFRQNIPPEIIGSKSNIELIPWLENTQKHSKCSISKEELYELYEQEVIKNNESL